MKRIAIVDDEAHARQFLKTMLAKFCPEVEIVGEADGVGTALQLIRQTRPDAVLLDISMEDGSGFDLLDFFPQLDFKVVFTTAHDEFALRAFHYAALDYLLKPIQPKDLIRALERVRETPILDYTEKIKVLLENARQHRPLTITLHTQEGLTLLKLEQIVYLSSDNAYTTFHLMQGEQLVVSRPIGDFEVLLPSDSFFRIHQSYLVNLTHVRKILKDEGGVVAMSNGSQLPLARRRKDEFIESVKRFTEN
ncbi:MAG: LytTR family DNA-binding domain-containing protein [Saprospiraceae bacterium]|nr:LytTR family DNA-binding domain-containing protein [Saprospiraceae bacterium]MCF8252599.1 LytTR family DNA-binding domain-containing protein [Saprospiraceae bacterium]MCF8282656.1 LytTR family DNA-binding domain-containing protein [Bacteroidales bacterium]MCF8314074.1 LytTR family DNA-binding domain-containing protein [Saprospiraceae bacterium]MCF8442942.1 LytTR family DNA-binding domain-containing protein [Saprospiraceae bacterium]